MLSKAWREVQEAQTLANEMREQNRVAGRGGASEQQERGDEPGAQRRHRDATEAVVLGHSSRAPLALRALDEVQHARPRVRKAAR